MKIIGNENATATCNSRIYKAIVDTKTEWLKVLYDGNVHYMFSAFYYELDGVYYLQSFDTVVATYDTHTSKFKWLWDSYSKATAAHAKAFLSEFGKVKSGFRVYNLEAEKEYPISDFIKAVA